ncbi:MAG: epoxyqueuosine reductase [Oscillospiraceae bacterium]|nr:epoxyqueuosine reductase [Oscillospiraceae bacterium]
MSEIERRIKEKLLAEGACDVGFGYDDNGVAGLKNILSIAVKLSDAVIDEISDAPTYTYFHHYRTVNAAIDRLLLSAGTEIERAGYRYIPVAASQSISNGENGYDGRYSHKKAAYLSGLGIIGKNNLFLHRKYGARVRLGTLFTDCCFEPAAPITEDFCSGCNKCVDSCPAKAFSGKSREGLFEGVVFDPEKCSNYMKKEFQKIGRGAVCGICMRVCEYGKTGGAVK